MHWALHVSSYNPRHMGEGLLFGYQLVRWHAIRIFPSMSSQAPCSPQFLFATGIEGSYPTILLPDGTKKRVDEFEACGHYARWEEDFALVKELGIQHLRYGSPYYRTHIGPGQYDWSFADESFTRLQILGITPIVDLCHFGVPDWIGDFQNPDWPPYFAEYARAFATRYPWVNLYTPVNEIFIAATFSAQYGWWNERRRDHRSFVTALKHLCQANVLAMRAIVAVHPQPTFIQSESSEYFHAEDPSCLPLAHALNEKRFLALDLSYGYPLAAEMYEYLLENGMTAAEYHWFRDSHLRANCIMGTDYYAANEHMVHADGTYSESGEIFGYYIITRQYFNRYHLPVMHAETNVAEPHSVQWLQKQWANMVRLKEDGIPIVGFTWYSLTDQVDWDTALRDNAGRVNPLGLYDINRVIRPVGEAYRTLIAQWKDILPTHSMALILGY
jgi:beta-glucosidase/6-phospho-beta-glucosidase/beta-galactosidase